MFSLKIFHNILFFSVSSVSKILAFYCLQTSSTNVVTSLYRLFQVNVKRESKDTYSLVIHSTTKTHSFSQERPVHLLGRVSFYTFVVKYYNNKSNN